MFLELKIESKNSVFTYRKGKFNHVFVMLNIFSLKWWNQWHWFDLLIHLNYVSHVYHSKQTTTTKELSDHPGMHPQRFVLPSHFQSEYKKASLVTQMVKNTPVMEETPGLGRFPEGGQSNSLQYSFFFFISWRLITL